MKQILKMEEKLDLKPLKKEIMKVKVIGITPLLSQPMDMDVVDMYDKKKGGKVVEKKIITEEEKAKTKYHYTSNGKKGIPKRSFYNSMIRASSYIIPKEQGGMRIVREGITILGDRILPLEYKKELMNHDWGRQSGMTRAPCKIVRPQFNDWSCELVIMFNRSMISPEQILNILNWAGFHIGVGSFRKEKSGDYGLFEVNIKK